MADRIKQRMQEIPMTQEELGKQAGLTQPAIYKLLSGKTQRTTRLAEIAKALKVRPEWLATGADPMTPNSDLTPDERRLVEGYRASSPAEKAALITLAIRGQTAPPIGKIQLQTQSPAGQA